MRRLIRRVLALFVTPAVVRSGDAGLVDVQYTDRSNQLSDNDLCIGTATRVALESATDYLTPTEVSVFYK
jgi:hypothetical protein